MIQEYKQYISHVSGVQVAYFFICRTKLWLFSHNIRQEKGYENVELGKILHENRYTNEKKEIAVGSTKYDFVRIGNSIEIHEVKKSDKLELSSRMQLLYYIFTLKENGVEATGVLDYPLMNKHKKIYLDEEAQVNIKNAIVSIIKIISGSTPQPEFKNYCKSCSYFDFCWC